MLGGGGLGGLFGGGQQGGGSNADNPQISDWEKRVAGIGMTGVGRAFFGGQWKPSAGGRDSMWHNMRLINEGNLDPYDTYPVEDRFATTPEQFNLAADYSLAAPDPMSGGVNQAMGLFESGTTFNPSRIQDYENAYSDGIIDEIYRIGAERLGEDLLPEVNSTFTSAGQFGSSRHEDFTARALRDTQREALGQVRQTLFDSRDKAIDQYGIERERDIAGGLGFAQLPGITQAADSNYINNLLRTGEVMRVEEQRPIDFDYSQWLRQENQMMDFLGAWTGQQQLSPSPMGGYVQSGGGGGGNMAQGILGGAATGASAGSYSGNPWVIGGGAVLGGLLGGLGSR